MSADPHRGGALGEATFRASATSAVRAPATVRWLVRRVLAEAGLLALAADAQLCASELVTNAVRLGRGVVRVRVVADEAGVLCEVSDSARVLPVVRRRVESGRGLWLVEAVASECGVRAPLAGGGKTCWFTVRSA